MLLESHGFGGFLWSHDVESVGHLATNMQVVVQIKRIAAILDYDE